MNPLPTHAENAMRNSLRPLPDLRPFPELRRSCRAGEAQGAFTIETSYMTIRVRGIEISEFRV